MIDSIATCVPSVAIALGALMVMGGNAGGWWFFAGGLVMQVLWLFFKRGSGRR
jgi:hypothetical protein